nr:YkgJ family cysteine cluster protein [Reinekea sp. G2M2-21]
MAVSVIAHSQADAEIANIKKVCQKGCNACCHQIVDVFTWEEPAIFKYLAKVFTAAQKKQLARNIKQWFNRFNRNTRPANRSSPLTFEEIRNVEHIFRENKYACPFLMGTSCSIYPVRPLVCRVHYQADSPNNCRIDPHITTPEDAQKVFYKAAENFDPTVFPKAKKPLAYLVAADFAHDIQSKPLQSVVYDPNNVFGRV